MKRAIIVLLVILGARCSYNENLRNAEAYLSAGDCLQAKRSIDAALKKDPNDSKTLELGTQIEKCLNKIKYQAHINNAKSMNKYELNWKLNEYKKALALNVNNAEALQLISSIENEITEKENQVQAILIKIDSEDYWAALVAYQAISNYRDSIQDIWVVYACLEASIPNMLDAIYNENSSSPIQSSIKAKNREALSLKKSLSCQSKYCLVRRKALNFF